MAGTCRRRTDARSRPSRARRRRSPTRRATMQKGEKIAGDLQRDRRSARRIGRRARQAAPGGARARPDRRRSSAARRSAGRARPRDHRGGARRRTRSTRAAEALAFDPAALEADETRLFELRGDGAQAPRPARRSCRAGATNCATRLDAIESGGAGLARLERALAEARDRLSRRRATRCPRARSEAAARLDAAVAGELAPLKLDAARFRTAVEPLAEERWGAGGHGPGRIPDLDQPRRAVRAADQDRHRAANCRASSSRSRSRWPKRAGRRR